MSDESESERVVEKELLGTKAPVVPVGAEPPDVPVGTPPAKDLIGDLNKAVERAEAANKATAALLDRQEALKVQQTLGGQASAGGPQDVLSDDQKKDAAAKKYLEGTGFEDEVFPDK